MAAWQSIWLFSTRCPACNLAAKHALWLLDRRWCAACVAQHAIWLPSLHFARILAGCHACAGPSDMQCGCTVCISAAWQARVASGGMQFGCPACILAAWQARAASGGMQFGCPACSLAAWQACLASGGRQFGCGQAARWPGGLRGSWAPRLRTEIYQ